MNPDISSYTNIESKYILLAFHYVLLLTKIYFVYFISNQMIFTKTPNNINFMFIFKPIEFLLLLLSVTITISELYYLSYFFVYDTIFLYEYLAIQDQIALTLFLIYYIKKGARDGKNQK